MQPPDRLLYHQASTSTNFRGAPTMLNDTPLTGKFGRSDESSTSATTQSDRELASGFPMLPGSGLRAPCGYAREMQKLPPDSPRLIDVILQRRSNSTSGGSGTSTS